MIEKTGVIEQAVAIEPASEKRPAILVFDEDETRGSGLCAQLASAGAQARHLCEDVAEIQESEDSGKIERWDMALVHGTDADTFRKRLKEIGGVGRIIYYSGSGGHDMNIPFGTQKIVRAIAVSIPPITKHEARELVRAASEYGYDPPLVLERVGLPVLRSLGVLTALYLGVQASCAEPGAKIAPGDWKQVRPDILEMMGWSQLPESLRQQLCNQQDGLPSHLFEVQRASWWIERLPVRDGPALQAALDSELRLVMERSGTKADAVRKLVGWISNVQSSTIEFELVEPCYLELASLPEL